MIKSCKKRTLIIFVNAETAWPMSVSRTLAKNVTIKF